jgi:heme exporter protein CcmD
MNHTPFIWSAYAIGTVVLLWCAIAPLMRRKTLTRDIRRLIQLEELDRDSHA